MVFAGIYPVVNSEYEVLRRALEKLQINDASLVWSPETSLALGFGFRCGFLGMLHMEIIKERLAREGNIDIVMTTPSVELHVFDKQGNMHCVHTPADMPVPEVIDRIEEPIVLVKIITKTAFVGKVIELCQANDIPVHQRNFSLVDTYGAEEAFLTGTFGAQTPVFEIDGRVIGGGKAGPVFQRIRGLYKDLIAEEVAKSRG